MVRGRNPDGTPKRWPADDRRAAKRRKATGYVESILNGTPAHDQVPHTQAWSNNPVLIRRLEVVERYRLEGLSAYEISRALGMPPATVLEDWQKLNDLWVARIGRTQETLRGEAVRRLDNVIRNGLEILRQDEAYTQAVLFNMPQLSPPRAACSPRSVSTTPSSRCRPRMRATTWRTSFATCCSRRRRR